MGLRSLLVTFRFLPEGGISNFNKIGKESKVQLFHLAARLAYQAK